MSDIKSKDIAAWEQWKKTKSREDLGRLLKQVDGVLQKEVNRWSGALARDVLEVEAARLAKQAFENYDPKFGASLSTHLTNHLQKLSREVYTHQNLARNPEYQTLKINTFQKAHTELEGQLGRAPSTTELSQHLMWSNAAVERMRKNMRKEKIESNELGPSIGRTESDYLVDLIHHDLTPLQKAIFEHSTGYGGAPVLSGQEMMKKLNLTQGQLSFQKKKIVDRVKGVNGG